MPTASTVPPGATTPRAWASVASLPTQSPTAATPPVSWSPITIDPVVARTARASSSGSHSTSAPSSLAQRRCSGCLAAATISVAGDRRRSAAMVSSPSVPDHVLRPAAARRLAEPALQPRFQVPECDPFAQVDVPGGALWAGRVHTPRGAREHRDHHHPATVLEVADDLVSGGERERDDGLEVARRAAVDGGEIAAADPRQARAQLQPPRARHVGRVHVPQRQGPVAGAAPRTQRSRHHRRRVAGGLASPPLPQEGPTGGGGWGSRPASSKCPPSQPRLRASAASRVSGLTATGK